MLFPIFGSFLGSPTWRVPALWTGQTGKNGPVTLDELAAEIHGLALSLPDTYEDRPWGDFPVYKVGENRVFAWAIRDDAGVHVTLKLTPEEREIAHLLPYVHRARYVGR